MQCLLFVICSISVYIVVRLLLTVGKHLHWLCRIGIHKFVPIRTVNVSYFGGSGCYHDSVCTRPNCVAVDLHGTKCERAAAECIRKQLEKDAEKHRKYMSRHRVSAKKLKLIKQAHPDFDISARSCDTD
jgi:hypothetical protein